LTTIYSFGAKKRLNNSSAAARYFQCFVCVKTICGAQRKNKLPFLIHSFIRLPSKGNLKRTGISVVRNGEGLALPAAESNRELFHRLIITGRRQKQPHTVRSMAIGIAGGFKWQLDRRGIHGLQFQSEMRGLHQMAIYRRRKTIGVKVRIGAYWQRCPNRSAVDDEHEHF